MLTNVRSGRSRRCSLPGSAQAQQRRQRRIGNMILTYPDWSGPMRFTARGGIVTTRPNVGRAQERRSRRNTAAIFEAGLRTRPRRQAATRLFLLSGRHAGEMAAQPGLEFLVTASHTCDLARPWPRRIYTDGRAWPDFIEPTLYGYSIANGPTRTATASSICSRPNARFMGRAVSTMPAPAAFDNQTVIKEAYLSRQNDPDMLHDE